MSAYSDNDDSKASRKAWKRKTEQMKSGQGTLMDGYMDEDKLIEFAKMTMGTGFVVHRFDVQIEREGNVCHVWLRLRSTEGKERSISYVHHGSRISLALLDAYGVAERMFVNARVVGL